MFRNIRRAVVSLLWVAIAFGIYSVAVVPFVESDTSGVEIAIDDFEGSFHATATDRFVRELEPLGFPAGSWELNTPKILRNQQLTILWEDFDQLDDGSLRVKPCTLVYYGSDRDNIDAERGPIVLQAPEGAVLNFDKPLNLARLSYGKPTGGLLIGTIRIFSSGGPESDDLEMVTSNVQITEQRIMTRERVTFRMGNHYGAGHDLSINRLEDDAPKRSHQGDDEDALAGLGIITLHHLERLSLLVDNQMFSSLGSPSSATSKAEMSASRVDLRCDGPMHLDLRRMIATVEKNVVVARQTKLAKPDTIHATRVSLHFARVAAMDPDSNQESQKTDISRVVGYGTPLVIDVPSEDAHVETRRLEYDALANRIKLRGFNPFAQPQVSMSEAPKVVLRMGTHELLSPAIDFVQIQDPLKRQIVAAGPGSYAGTVPNEDALAQHSKHAIAVQWSNKMSLQPVADNQILRIDGKASFRSAKLGSLHADTIELWLQQVHSATTLDQKPVYELVPIQLVTHSKQGRKTTVSTPQLHGTLTKMTVVFEQRMTAAAPENAPSDPIANSLTSKPLPTQNEGLSSRYRVQGGEVTAWIDPGNQSLHRMVVVGDSQLIEEPKDGGLGTEIHATRIDYENDAEGQPVMQLEGQPAMVSFPQGKLRGNEIMVLGSQNRIIVPGVGSLTTKPTEISSKTMPSNLANQEIEFEWSNGLEFDGQVITIDGSVKAHGEDLAIKTADLKITLDSAIDLSSLDGQTLRPTIAVVTADNGVYASVRGRNDAGTVESFQQIVTRDLRLDYQTGETVSNGPGWFSVTMLASLLPPLPGASKSEQAADTLVQLSGTFERQLTGNIHRREARIDDNVRCWFGAVEQWTDRVDPLRVNTLGEDEMTLACQEVLIYESPTAVDDAEQKPVELVARGGAYVESQLYAAKGDEIKYAQDKGMLTLIGKQRLAELWQRASPDAKGTMSGNAKRIRFWTETGQLAVEGGRGADIDLSGLPSEQR